MKERGVHRQRVKSEAIQRKVKPYKERKKDEMKEEGTYQRQIRY
jgi:hypothetical protein